MTFYSVVCTAHDGSLTDIMVIGDARLAWALYSGRARALRSPNGYRCAMTGLYLVAKDTTAVVLRRLPSEMEWSEGPIVAQAMRMEGK